MLELEIINQAINRLNNDYKNSQVQILGFTLDESGKVLIVNFKLDQFSIPGSKAFSIEYLRKTI